MVAMVARSLLQKSPIFDLMFKRALISLVLLQKSHILAALFFKSALSVCRALSKNTDMTFNRVN